VNFIKLLSLICLVVVFVSCGSPPQSDAEKSTFKFKVIVVFDQAGLGDQGFNDAAWAGIAMVEKEMKRRGSEFESDNMESREEAGYLADLEAAANRADVVVSVGALFAEEVTKAARKHPDSRFIHIEGGVDAPNVLLYNFRSEHGGFLAGIVAGLRTKSGKIGVVTGVNITPVVAYECGFRAGAKVAGRIRNASGEKLTVEVNSATANSFNDPEKGKALAQMLIAKGADVLFRIAGNTGQGVYQAVKENPKALLIWEDVDRRDAIPGRIVACTLKRVDKAVFEGVMSAVDKKFKGGSRVLGIAEGGMALVGPFLDSKKKEDIALARAVNHFKKLVAENKLAVPSTRQELTAFDSSGPVKEFLANE